ncbi:MAG: orotidine-5'-phosphate decarboxylase [Bacteroidetes bacterium]|nr:orotidine-5'-phosphate decarboxylase [Bacteroidota bacterium]MBS1629615.1 orotidine-5'-phosphate decarboxylase [Bacteroidota bacterium]
MNRQQLVAAIRQKKSVLCVGLDTSPEKLPEHLQGLPDGVLRFNKAIIDATRDYAVAYKINTAFYEAQGLHGWSALQETLAYLPSDVFSIADAKRGDIGNTADQYAKTFFETYPFHSVTVAPYMGEDSVRPFLNHKGHWAIVLGLTSNKGSQDFQMLRCGEQFLFEEVLRKVATWGSPEQLMFVIGATQDAQLRRVRELLPEHFLLIPGIGAQGGDLHAVCKSALNQDAGILVNVSRGIIYAGHGADFATCARDAAAAYQQQMSVYL